MLRKILMPCVVIKHTQNQNGVLQPLLNAYSDEFYNNKDTVLLAVQFTVIKASVDTSVTTSWFHSLVITLKSRNINKDTNSKGNKRKKNISKVRRLMAIIYPEAQASYSKTKLQLKMYSNTCKKAGCVKLIEFQISKLL